MNRKPKRTMRSEPLVPTKARLQLAKEAPKQYCKPQPCNNCPYRQDAPLEHWSVEEFVTLEQHEQSEMGKVYGCHKKDGCVCTGWLMNQDKQDFPSIALRVSLSRNNVSREFLDELSSPSPLYPSVAAMCHANYPDVFPAPQ